MMSNSVPYKSMGYGLGLRPHYYEHFLATRKVEGVDWVEVISENYLRWMDGRWENPVEILEKVRHNYPVACHGVSLSLGSTDAISKEYLFRLKELVDRIEPIWVSDHLSWSTVQAVNHHDLLPLPLTYEALDVVCKNILQVQDYLQRPILVENISSYMKFHLSEMPEWEFMTEVSKKTDCFLLLDVNNVYVNAFNHGYDPMDFLENVTMDRVKEIHLAGHRKTSHSSGDILIDTHDEPVNQDVWNLFKWVKARAPWTSTLVEWDDQFPEFSVLISELHRAKEIDNKNSETLGLNKKKEDTNNDFTRFSETILPLPS